MKDKILSILIKMLEEFEVTFREWESIKCFIDNRYRLENLKTKIKEE